MPKAKCFWWTFTPSSPSLISPFVWCLLGSWKLMKQSSKKITLFHQFPAAKTQFASFIFYNSTCTNSLKMTLIHRTIFPWHFVAVAKWPLALLQDDPACHYYTMVQKCTNYNSWTLLLSRKFFSWIKRGEKIQINYGSDPILNPLRKCCCWLQEHASESWKKGTSRSILEMDSVLWYVLQVIIACLDIRSQSPRTTHRLLADQGASRLF